MQGQLRNQNLTFSITSECGHCHQPLHLEIDSHLNYRIKEGDAEPMIFVPMLGKIKDKSIIDAF